MLQFIVHNINLRRRHCEQWQRKIFCYISITASPALPSSASWKAANWISFKSGFSKGIRKEVVEHEANHKLRTEGKMLDNAQRMSSSFHCDPTVKFPLLRSRRAAYLNEFNFLFEVRRGTKHFSSLSCSATSHLLFRARRFRPFTMRRGNPSILNVKFSSAIELTKLLILKLSKGHRYWRNPRRPRRVT